MKKYEQILLTEKRCIIDMIKDYNEKLHLYYYMRNLLVSDAEWEMLQTFGPKEVEEVLLLLLLQIPCDSI